MFFYSFSAIFSWHAPLLCFTNLIYCVCISSRRKTHIMLISCPSPFPCYFSEPINRSIQTLKILIILIHKDLIRLSHNSLFVFVYKIICRIRLTMKTGNKKVEASGHVSNHCHQHTCMLLSLEADINNDRFYAKGPASQSPGHYTYLNSRFCTKFTLHSLPAKMSGYNGETMAMSCPFLCCKLGVTQKPLRPNRAHNVQPPGRGRPAAAGRLDEHDFVKNYGFTYLYFFWCPLDTITILIFFYLKCSNRCTVWFKFLFKKC